MGPLRRGSHPYETGELPRPFVLAGREHLRAAGGAVTFATHHKAVVLGRRVCRHLPAPYAPARVAVLLHPREDELPEVARLAPGGDVVLGDLSLDPHDPVPGR